MQNASYTHEILKSLHEHEYQLSTLQFSPARAAGFHFSASGSFVPTFMHCLSPRSTQSKLPSRVRRYVFIETQDRLLLLTRLKQSTTVQTCLAMIVTILLLLFSRQDNNTLPLLISDWARLSPVFEHTLINTSIKGLHLIVTKLFALFIYLLKMNRHLSFEPWFLVSLGVERISHKYNFVNTNMMKLTYNIATRMQKNGVKHPNTFTYKW